MRTGAQVLALVALLVGSGIGDSQGFVHASRIWEQGRSAGLEVARSAVWFAMGIGLYWLSLYWARKVGIVSTGVQTLLWFTVTIVGVAVLTGELRRWDLADQMVAGTIVVLMGVLVYRASGG